MNGQQLIDWGFEPGPWFAKAILEATNMELRGSSFEEIREHVATLQPKEITKIGLRSVPVSYGRYITPETDDEVANTDAVFRDMDLLMSLPTVVNGAVMPDACPAGIIPVGGVVATKNAIHPGFHSADICCSMAISVLNQNVNLKALLDIAHAQTHFGLVKKEHQRRPPVGSAADKLILKFHKNFFLDGLEDIAFNHYMTQGDGNHFLFIGTRKSDKLPCIVTHHGSRGLGAQLYKKALRYAHQETNKIAKDIPKEASWFEADSYLGEQYWVALQQVRLWTKYNHFAIHNRILDLIRMFSVKYSQVDLFDRFWNEHNFVFQRNDGLFYHAKGATPSYAGFSEDDDGRCIIPMNMAEPILITKHTNNNKTLGFAPHGAGRNMSRTKFLKSEPDTSVPAHVDLRSFCGHIDPTELPDAYKNSASVIKQIKEHNLTEITDEILPYGSIMAGNVSSYG